MLRLSTLMTGLFTNYYYLEFLLEKFKTVHQIVENNELIQHCLNWNLVSEILVILCHRCSIFRLATFLNFGNVVQLYKSIIQNLYRYIHGYGIFRIVITSSFSCMLPEMKN
jgi:hypothetical protein